MPPVSPSLVTHASARVRPVGALWRLRGYLKPFRVQMVVMFAAAFGAVTAEIIIPLLTKAVVDGAIAHGDRRLLIPLSLAAIGLGVAEALLNLIRRWIQADAVASMEKTIRDDMYAHLQRLQASFHDNWQSGQLLSRATTDLSAIRRFAGFGLIFMVTNVMTFVAVIALLIHLNWWLGLVTGAVFAPVLPVCFRFEKRYRVLSRRVQDQQGDLATLIEEAATGIRVLKALGRGRLAGARHGAQATEVYRTQVEKAGLLGSFWALLDLIPNAVIGIVIVLGALAVSSGSLTLGGLVAFITLALQLVWPVEALGYIIASGQEAATAAQRVLEIFDAQPEITDKTQDLDTERTVVRALRPTRNTRPRDGAPGVTWCSTTWPSGIPGRPNRSCGTSCSTCRRARRWCSPGPPARVSPPCCSSCRGWPTRRRARSGWTGRTSATSRWPGSARRSGARSRTPRCSRPACGRTSCSARRTRTRPRSRPR